FLLAGVLAGAGAGVLFKSAVGHVAATAAPAQRGEALAGLFLASYLGLALLPVGLGVASLFMSLGNATTWFTAVVLALLAAVAVGRVGFVDAPVSGSSQPAERGELLVLASGHPVLRPRVQPLFDAVGQRTLWLEHLGDGSRFKLVLNNWLAVLVEGMAETVSL